MTSASAQYSEDTLALGSKLRVWRRALPSNEHGEWAEVIRAEVTGPREWLFCETLGFAAFWFSPQQVAEGTDEEVSRFQPAKELRLRTGLLRSEVCRLHEALNPAAGTLRELWPTKDPAPRGFTVAPPQLRVKATLLSCRLEPKERAELQDLLERRVELAAEKKALQSEPCSPASPAGPLPASPCAGGARRRRYVQEAAPPPAGAGARSRHRPDLCTACIGGGGWCSGSFHHGDCAVRLDRAARQLGPDLRWSACEAGVEAVIDHGGEAVLLQLRPWLFCVSEGDAALFGASVLQRSSSQDTIASSTSQSEAAQPNVGRQLSIATNASTCASVEDDGGASKGCAQGGRCTAADGQSHGAALAPLSALLGLGKAWEALWRVESTA